MSVPTFRSGEACLGTSLLLAGTDILRVEGLWDTRWLFAIVLSVSKAVEALNAGFFEGAGEMCYHRVS